MAPRTSPILIAGPTAVGKSAIALALAERIGGEIVSVDSMQVYRGLDIGTAKPSDEERVRVPHHLIDILDLTGTFDAAQFVTLAGEAVEQIQSRGRVPILCGGTGLYFKAFLEGLGNAPRPDPVLRAELEATPLSELLRELAERDPGFFEAVDRRNRRRIVRAIEVIRLTGRPYSEQRAVWRDPAAEPNSPPGSRATPAFGLMRSTGELRRRIDARVEEMFQRGLVDETRRALDAGLEANPTAMQALGYRQVVAHLRGELPLSQTIELVKVRTRQFAKRQMTWFRRQLDLTWIELTSEMSDASVVERILSRALD